MPDLLQLARAKRAALAMEIAKLDQFIATAKQLAESADAPELLTVTSSATATDNFPQFLRRTEKVTKKGQVLAVCRELIREHGPQPASAMYQVLQSRQINPGTKDPRGMLSVMLHRSEEFSHDKERGLWGFAKGNAPAGNHR